MAKKAAAPKNINGPSDYHARETWLAKATQHFREHFNGKGWVIPEKLRVSCGLPSGRAFSSRKRAIGEAWCSKASKDQHFEIFVSPTIDEPRAVLSTLAHELVHVTVGIDKGHKGVFIQCAQQIGLKGPWTCTVADDSMVPTLDKIEATLGAYPHRSLMKMTNGKKKQSTRMLKCVCDNCGYTVRGSLQWFMLAVPKCPNSDCTQFEEEMHVEMPDDEEVKEHREAKAKEKPTIRDEMESEDVGLASFPNDMPSADSLWRLSV